MNDFLTRLAELVLGAAAPVQPVIPSLYSPSLSTPGLQAPVENEGGMGALAGEESLAHGHFETSDGAEAGELERPEDQSRRIGPSVKHASKPVARIPSLSGTSTERVPSPLSPEGQIRDRVKRNEPHAEGAEQQPASPELAEAGDSRRLPAPATQRGPRGAPSQLWHRVEKAVAENAESVAAESISPPFEGKSLPSYVPIVPAASAPRRNAQEESQVGEEAPRVEGKTLPSYVPIVPAASAPRRYAPEESQIWEESSPHPGDQQTSAARRKIRPATRSARGEPSLQIQTQSPASGDRGSSPASEASTIQVTIGRIEVRAVRSSDPPPQQASLPAPRLSLEDFLKRHNENRR